MVLRDHGDEWIVLDLHLDAAVIVLGDVRIMRARKPTDANEFVLHRGIQTPIEVVLLLLVVVGRRRFVEAVIGVIAQVTVL